MDDRCDVTIEVWTPRAAPPKRLVFGLTPRRWVRIAAAMVLITVGVILLTRRR